MKKQKLTKWFPGHIVPYHKGVYEVKATTGILKYSKWNGKNWMWMKNSADEANSVSWKSMDQRKEWRGIVK